MKCIKKGLVAKRVSDERAARLVAQGWAYCSKTEYRDSRKEKEPENADL